MDMTNLKEEYMKSISKRFFINEKKEVPKKIHNVKTFRFWYLWTSIFGIK